MNPKELFTQVEYKKKLEVKDLVEFPKVAIEDRLVEIER